MSVVLSHVFAALARPTFRSGVRLASRTALLYQKSEQLLKVITYPKMFKSVERGCPNSLDYRVYIGN